MRLAILSVLALTTAASVPHYRDAAAPIEERVGDLMKRMTLEEKIAQTYTPYSGFDKKRFGSTSIGSTSSPPQYPSCTMISGLCLPLCLPLAWSRLLCASSLLLVPSPSPVPAPTVLSVNPATGKAGSASPAALVAARNVIQSTLVNGSRLGIPASFSQEALHSATQGGTVFPELVTQGSSWDPSLVEAIAAAIAVEARATGVDVAFSPVLNQWVDARFGRLQEGFSENPTVRRVCCCSRYVGGTARWR